MVKSSRTRKQVQATASSTLILLFSSPWTEPLLRVQIQLAEGGRKEHVLLRSLKKHCYVEITSVQLWGFFWPVINHCPLDSLTEGLVPWKLIRQSLQPQSIQLKERRVSFGWCEQRQISSGFYPVISYTTSKTTTNAHISFIKASLSFRTLWSWKISSNVCFVKRLESRTLVSFCLSVLLRVLF